MACGDVFKLSGAACVAAVARLTGRVPAGEACTQLRCAAYLHPVLIAPGTAAADAVMNAPWQCPTCRAALHFVRMTAVSFSAHGCSDGSLLRWAVSTGMNIGTRSGWLVAEVSGSAAPYDAERLRMLALRCTVGYLWLLAC